MGANETKGPGSIATADGTTVTGMVAAHARRIPDAPAVQARGRQHTYAELDARIDRLAARVASRLCNGERLVGVCLERDVDLPAWLLAIHRVGGAYCPIDPATPPARLAAVIEDARPALIVASSSHASVVADAGVPVMIAEDIAEDEEKLPALAAFPVQPDTLAYVIFTSGSTGRPKGVEIEHGSLVALMQAMAVTPGLAEGERMLGLTRISFDLSVPDLFLPFFVGGSLALVDLEVAADPARLVAAIDLHRPDLVQGTPSTWRALIEGGWQGLPALRIVAGGEAVTRALADHLLSRCGKLWNLYGPTEATVWATAGQVAPGDGTVPIGRPLTGATVTVAGADGAPRPAGETGEIVIGGVGVARGYRGRSDLTAERFIRLADGTRAYRTGDLGHVDEHGALHCLGRLDDQVKVRGFRIELGDVEAALAGGPSVGWCAARVWTDRSCEPVLVAYVVPCAGTGSGADRRAIRSFLATRLAPYMLPDRIVVLAAMPLTPNGKIDRAALPDPFADTEPTLATMTRTDTRGRLAAIWAALLSQPTIALHDDFFDLGGYSLMTVRLARQVEEQFGVRLALIDLMRHSTLSAMAARIDRDGSAAPSGTMLLNAGGHRSPLFWLDAGPLMRTIARGLSADQPALTLNTDAADEEALGSGALSIPALASRLKARLLAEQPAGPYYLGGWCRWGIVAFELARQLVDEGETVGLLVLLDADLPGRPPPPRRLRSRFAEWLRPPETRRPDEPPSFSQRVEIATRGYSARRYAGDVLLLRPAATRGDAGWPSVVDGSVVVERTPGDHVTMVRGANAAILATAIDRALLVAQREHRDASAAPVQAAWTTRS
jgi:amino acid adenylation domain-containing protein